jgi:hypothetical protein
MALAFFRRRQKMVIVVMAILMVSFLIGFQGFDIVTRRDPGKRTIARIRGGKITYNDLVVAENDLRLLGYFNYNYPDQNFLNLRSNNEQSVATYAMLLQEAQVSHVRIGSEDVGNYFMQRGLVGPEFQSFLAGVKSVLSERVTEGALRETVARWLKIVRLAEESMSVPPLSGLEMAQIYRDLAEKIKLELVTISAEDSLAQVPDPNEDVVAAQFSEFRSFPPGQYSNANPFGFGYMQPNQARVAYLLARQDVVRRSCKPREETVRDYFRRHAAEMVKKVPVTATQPAAGASQPTSQPVEYRQEPMSFPEAKAQIVEKLTEEACQPKMDELLTRAAAMLEDFAKSGQPAETNPFEWIRDRMTASAEAVLARSLEDVKIDGESLESAVSTLAEKAGLDAIVFPWGDQGERKLNPAVKVRLSAANISLGEALDKVCQQVKWPKLTWAMSGEFDGVLFSVGGKDGVDFFPVTAPQVPLMDAQAMKTDAVLGQATTASGQHLADDMVFSAEPFFQDRRGGSMLKVNDDGPRMDVGGESAGRMLWRLMEAMPAHAPATMDAAQGLRDTVKKDCKIKAAYALAVERAEKIQAQAAKSHLAVVAKQEKLAVIGTDLFARRLVVSPPRQYAALAQRSGQQMTPEFYMRLANMQPFVYLPSRLETVPLPGDFLTAQFIEAAFALAPENVEPPYAKEPPAVGLAPSPATRQVFVIERVDYVPAVGSLFQEQLGNLVRQQDMLRRWQARRVWFSHQGVAERIDYRPLTASEE